MGEWRETPLGYRLYDGDRLLAGVNCEHVNMLGMPRAWYWHDEDLRKFTARLEPFPDVASAKRWCERELAFAGLEAIA